MRILQLTSHLDVGGITRYVLSLSEQLSARGHRVIIASDDGQLEHQVRALGLTHWRLPLHTSAEFSLPVFRAGRQLMARLRMEPVEVIHAHTRVAQVLASALSHRLHIPYVTTWHGIYKRRLGRRLWPCTGDRTIAISEPVHQHLLQDFQVPEARVRLIYNGIDTMHYAAPPSPEAIQAYRERHQIPSRGRLVGGIGRLASGRVKGFDLILVAAKVLQEVVPDLHVLLVGDGPRRPFLEEIAARLGLRDCVHFVGAANDIRVPLALMDVFVFPSRWPEGFGLTLIEAMAAGKPVVATRSGAVSEIVQHDVTGWLTPSDDPAALAQAIQHLLTDQATAKRLGHAAQTHVREVFTLDRMAEQVEALYREVVAAGSR